MGTEGAARQLRYAFLTDCAAEHGYDWIATAHTADDNAETLLLNLARGCGLRGLTGIPPQRGKLLRPMLDTTRAEAEAYLAAHGIAHVEDSTNASDAYARNRVRHHAVPALESVNAAFVQHAADTAALLREDERFLGGLAAEFLAGQTPAEGILTAELLALPRPVRVRVLQQAAGRELSRRHLLALEQLCGGEGLGYADIPGLRVTREQGRLFFGAQRRPPLGTYALIPGQATEIPELGVRFTVGMPEPFREIHSAFTTFVFKSAIIHDKLSVTPRRPGDRIRLAGARLHQARERPACRAGLTQDARERVPIIRAADARRPSPASASPSNGRRCRIKPWSASGWNRSKHMGENTMSDMRDDIASVLLSAEDIQKRTAELGARISKDFDGREPLFVGVLKGCFVFMADLMRSVTIPCSVDFMAVSSYGNQTTTTGAVKINKDLNQDIEGRDIILVEDILDSGVTLHYLADYLSVRRPASITIATLLDKPARRKAPIHATYAGFEVPDAFVVGYGLDYAEKYRNLPFIGVLKPEVYSH